MSDLDTAAGIIARGRAPVRAIEALGTAEPNGPTKGATRDVVVSMSGLWVEVSDE